VHRHRTSTTRERTPVEGTPACPRSLSMVYRAGVGSQAARPSIVSRPRWPRARSRTRRGSDPRESLLRTRPAPISARRSLLTARRRCCKGKPAGVAAHRTFACKYRRDQSPSPRLRPKLQSMVPPDRTTPGTCRPSWRSNDGVQGTRLNPSPSSIMAKRPDARMTR